MTTERAIELLHRISDSQFDGEYGDERREALDMAVRALEGDGDTISRQAAMVTAIRAVIDWNRFANPQYSIAYCIGEAMRQLPSAQPKRKTGKWIDGQCSICGCDIPAYIIDWKWQKDMSANYCPNCGARMEGESE